MVRMAGIEPALQRNRILNPARLPVPPHPHMKYAVYKGGFFKKLALISAIFSFFSRLIERATICADFVAVGWQSLLGWGRGQRQFSRRHIRRV